MATPEHTPTAIITGGTGALGSVLVREFRRAGYRVAVPVRSSPPPRDDSDGLRFVRADLSRDADTGAFVQDVLKALGTIDVLVHAAGGFSGGRTLEDTAPAEWDRMLQINLQTAFQAIRAVLPAMRSANRGRIICIGALAGLRPAPRIAAYGVAKRALAALVEAVAEENRESGITCNLVAPGTILTQANLKSMPEADSSTWVRPEEIAALCLFLASDAGARITGTALRLPDQPREKR